MIFFVIHNLCVTFATLEHTHRCLCMANNILQVMIRVHYAKGTGEKSVLLPSLCDPRKNQLCDKTRHILLPTISRAPRKGRCLQAVYIHTWHTRVRRRSSTLWLSRVVELAWNNNYSHTQNAQNTPSSWLCTITIEQQYIEIYWLY